MCVTREIPNRQYPTSGQIVAIIVDSVTVDLFGHFGYHGPKRSELDLDVQLLVPPCSFSISAFLAACSAITILFFSSRLSCLTRPISLAILNISPCSWTMKVPTWWWIVIPQSSPPSGVLVLALGFSWDVWWGKYAVSLLLSWMEHSSL